MGGPKERCRQQEGDEWQLGDPPSVDRNRAESWGAHAVETGRFAHHPTRQSPIMECWAMGIRTGRWTAPGLVCRIHKQQLKSKGRGMQYLEEDKEVEGKSDLRFFPQVCLRIE